MPSTWRMFSKEVYGYELAMTPERERYVVTKMVSDWMATGLTPAQVALRWNAGGNATKCSSGTNSYGVKYDSCKHVQTVLMAMN